MKFTFLFLVLLINICAFVSVAQARINVDSRDNNNIAVTTSLVRISVTGGQNVPKFTVQRLGSDDLYKIQFQNAFQASELATNGGRSKPLAGSKISLPSLGWTFGNWTLGTDSSNLSFTLTSSSINQNTPVFSFKVYVNETLGAAVKFDTTVSNFKSSTWKNNAQYLAICYKMIQQSTNTSSEATPSQAQGSSDARSIRFGGAAIESVPTATEANTTRQIQALLHPNGDDDTSSSDKMACTYYEKFTEGMTHDPTFAIIGNSASKAFTSVGFAFVFALIAIIASAF